MGFVYLINEWGTDNYKIGVTKESDVNKRKKKLQTGNSNELCIVRDFSCSYPYKLEGMLHRYYIKGHIFNEWFLLSDVQVNDFVNVCKNFDDTINYLVESGNPFYNITNKTNKSVY